MADPKPITLTQVDEGDYAGPAPQPFVAVGGVGAPTQGAFDALVARVEALEAAAA